MGFLMETSVGKRALTLGIFTVSAFYRHWSLSLLYYFAASKFGFHLLLDSLFPDNSVMTETITQTDEQEGVVNKQCVGV